MTAFPSSVVAEVVALDMPPKERQRQAGTSIPGPLPETEASQSEHRADLLVR